MNIARAQIEPIGPKCHKHTEILLKDRIESFDKDKNSNILVDMYSYVTDLAHVATGKR
jgi:hypothetical protein